MTRAEAAVLVLSAVVTGVIWGPAIHAPWYGFFLAAPVGLVLGLVMLAVSRVGRLGGGASAVATGFVVVIVNVAVLLWGASRSH